MGGFCQVAYQLNRLGLRTASYPFDWLFTLNFERTIECIENDFRDYLLFENLIEELNTPTEHKKITDVRYDMVHQHSFPLNVPLQESYPEIKKLTDRRVQRLLDLQGQNLRLLFVRTNLSCEQSKQLGEVLRKKFGEQTQLLVVNHTKNKMIKEIESPTDYIRIFEIYDENSGKEGDRWQGFDSHWDEIFRQIGIRHRTMDLRQEEDYLGFYPCEKDERGKLFRWSGVISAIRLPMDGERNGELHLYAPVAVSVSGRDNNGNHLFCETIEGEQVILFDCKAEADLLCLKVEETWRPSQRFGYADERELGFALKSVRL